MPSAQRKTTQYFIPEVQKHIQVITDSDVEKELDALSAGYLTKHSHLFSNTERRYTKDEVERAFAAYCQNLPANVKNRATLLSVNKSFDAAQEYLREEFHKTHPHMIPYTQQGRPRGYMSHNTRLKISKGFVIRRLLELAGDQLRKELESNG